MRNISSRLHQALEEDPSNPFLGLMTEYPYFVIEEEMQDLFNKRTTQESVYAMMKHGVGKLPYPMMSIELWGGSANWRYFLLLAEGKAKDTFEFVLIEHQHKQPLNKQMLRMELRASFKYVESTTSDGAQWHIEYRDHVAFATNHRQDILHHCVAALNIALLMSHMSEIEREVIESTKFRKLNKARERNGKPTIQKHVVVRIGHVYDNNGNKVYLNDGNRKTMKIHMRSGHTRRQRYGKNLEKVKTIWIAPVLINYNDGSELPLPLPRVVRK